MNLLGLQLRYVRDFIPQEGSNKTNSADTKSRAADLQRYARSIWPLEVVLNNERQIYNFSN